MSIPALTAKQYASSEFEALSKEMASWHAQVDAIEAVHYDEDYFSQDRELSDVAYSITDKMKKRLLEPKKEDLVFGVLDVKGRLQAFAICSFSIDYPHKCLLHYIVTHPNNLTFASIQQGMRISGAASFLLKAVGKFALLHNPNAEVHAQAYEVSLPFFAKNHFVKHLSKPEGPSLTPVVLTNAALLKHSPKEEKKTE